MEAICTGSRHQPRKKLTEGHFSGLTCDPRGTVVAHHLLRLRHHRTAEAIVTGAWLAATGVVWVIVETNGTVSTLNVRVLVPCVAISWKVGERNGRVRQNISFDVDECGDQTPEPQVFPKLPPASDHWHSSPPINQI